MDIVALQAPLQFRIQRIGDKETVAARQLQCLTRQQPVPAAVGDPPSQHPVEQEGARRRQRQPALVSRQAPGRTVEQACRRDQVAAAPAEALLAKVVRHTLRGHLLQARVQAVDIAGQPAQPQAKGIALQGATTQLAGVPGMRQQGNGAGIQRLPVGVGPPRQVHREPLFGDRVAVLQAGVADIAQRHPGELRQPAGDRRRVFFALADQQPGMFTLTGRLDQRQFGDLEIPGAGTHPATHRRTAMRTGKVRNGGFQGVGERAESG